MSSRYRSDDRMSPANPSESSRNQTDEAGKSPLATGHLLESYEAMAVATREMKIALQKEQKRSQELERKLADAEKRAQESQRFAEATRAEVEERISRAREEAGALSQERNRINGELRMDLDRLSRTLRTQEETIHDLNLKLRSAQAHLSSYEQAWKSQRNHEERARVLSEKLAQTQAHLDQAVLKNRELSLHVAQTSAQQSAHEAIAQLQNAMRFEMQKLRESTEERLQAQTRDTVSSIKGLLETDQRSVQHRDALRAEVQQLKGRLQEALKFREQALARIGQLEQALRDKAQSENRAQHVQQALEEEIRRLKSRQDTASKAAPVAEVAVAVATSRANGNAGPAPRIPTRPAIFGNSTSPARSEVTEAPQDPRAQRFESEFPIREKLATTEYEIRQLRRKIRDSSQTPVERQKLTMVLESLEAQRKQLTLQILESEARFRAEQRKPGSG